MSFSVPLIPNVSRVRACGVSRLFRLVLSFLYASSSTMMKWQPSHVFIQEVVRLWFRCSDKVVVPAIRHVVSVSKFTSCDDDDVTSLGTTGAGFTGGSAVWGWKPPLQVPKDSALGIQIRLVRVPREQEQEESCAAVEDYRSSENHHQQHSTQIPAKNIKPFLQSQLWTNLISFWILAGDDLIASLIYLPITVFSELTVC